MAETFSAQVDRFIFKSKRVALAIVQQSAQDVIEVMQKPVGAGGNMPVDTGFLRASLEAQIGSAPTGFKTKTKFTKGAYVLNEASYTLTINRMKLGDVLYAAYLANYAAAQEYGTKFMTGRGFVRLAALQWQSIVSANVKKLRDQR